MGRVRRYWSADEKRRICGETAVPGVSVAQVARRYSMNANLLFTWLRDPRFAPAPEGAVFLPVEVSPSPMADMAAAPSRASDRAGRVSVELSDGRRVVAEGRFDGEALGRMLRVWLS